MLKRAWRRGTILCGLSAGSLCWFAEAITAFHGPPQVVRGLGLLPYANCVHYDGEPSRRTAFHERVAAGTRPGFGVEDGAALRFAGREVAEVVSSRPAARAYRVEPDGRGGAAETRLSARYLGEQPLVAVA
jgi:peptidase E